MWKSCPKQICKKHLEIDQNYINRPFFYMKENSLVEQRYLYIPVFSFHLEMFTAIAVIVLSLVYYTEHASKKQIEITANL